MGQGKGGLHVPRRSQIKGKNEAAKIGAVWPKAWWVWSEPPALEYLRILIAKCNFRCAGSRGC